MFVPLLLRTWRDRWRGIVGWTLGIVAISIVMMWVYPSITASPMDMEALAQSFPEAFQEFFRMTDYTSGPGYLGTEMFSFMVPLVFIAVGASWGASGTAEEEERGTADLLFSLPLSRSAVLIAKMVAAILVLVVVFAATFTSLYVGAQVVDMEIGTQELLAACVTNLLLGMLFAGLSFLIGAATGRKSIALGISITVALAAFLMYSLAPLVDTFDAVIDFNPFQWALGNLPLYNGFDVGYVVNLLVASLVLMVASLFVFQRRDITS